MPWKSVAVDGMAFAGTPQDTGLQSMTEKQTIVVWDVPVRLFHWTLLAVTALAFATAEAEGAWFVLHLAAGYAVMALLVFRLAWGFAGTRYARFGEFVYPWPVVRRHAANVARLRPRRYVGHNPLGGWMIMALLVVLGLLVASGLFAGDEGEKGPLAHWLSAGVADAIGELHEGLNTVLWTLVAVHVAGVVIESLLTGENLIRALWTGKKEVENAEADSGPVGALPLMASLVLAVAAVIAVAW